MKTSRLYTLVGIGALVGAYLLDLSEKDAQLASRITTLEWQGRRFDEAFDDLVELHQDELLELTKDARRAGGVVS